MEVLLGIDTIGPVGAEEGGTSRALDMLLGGSDVITCNRRCSRSFQGEREEVLRAEGRKGEKDGKEKGVFVKS